MEFKPTQRGESAHTAQSILQRSTESRHFPLEITKIMSWIFRRINPLSAPIPPVLPDLQSGRMELAHLQCDSTPKGLQIPTPNAGGFQIRPNWGSSPKGEAGRGLPPLRGEGKDAASLANGAEGEGKQQSPPWLLLRARETPFSGHSANNSCFLSLFQFFFVPLRMKYNITS